MNGRILVAYASRTGSTAGVAEVIGKTLAESGAQVDVLSMKDVKDLSPYRAVVAGSAIQAAQWLPEAMQFVQAHQAELARKPFAAFLVCMTLAMKAGQGAPNRDYRQQVSAWLDPVCALVQPVSGGRNLPRAGREIPRAGREIPRAGREIPRGLFAGALDISKVPSFGDRLKFRLSVKMGVWSEGDHRDWSAIRAWAEGLRPLLFQ